jgi:hypothetical protein
LAAVVGYTSSRRQLKFALRKTEARMLAGKAEELPADQNVVLYLRSFDDDERSSQLIGDVTEEEHVSRMLAYVGQLVAIGRPGEAMPHLGARRIYRADDDWQAEVDRLLTVARLVVIRTGGSSGLQWEIGRALEMAEPLKLLVIIDDSDEFDDLVVRIRQYHPVTVPAIEVGRRSFGNLLAFADFDEHWTARLVPMKRPGFRMYKHQDMSPAPAKLARTFQPVLDRLGVGGPTNSIHWLRVLYLIVLPGVLMLTLVTEWTGIID